MEKKLYRSRTDRMIWGVCGGLGKYFSIDPVIIRIIFLLLLMPGGFGILAYIILALVVPLEESKASQPKEVVKENVEEIKKTAEEVGQGIRSTFGEGERTEADRLTQNRIGILGLILIILGIIFLLFTFRVLPWLNWGNFWPIILIVIGLLIIFNVRRR